MPYLWYNLEVHVYRKDAMKPIITPSQTSMKLQVEETATMPHNIELQIGKLENFFRDRPLLSKKAKLHELDAKMVSMIYF